VIFCALVPFDIQLSTRFGGKKKILYGNDAQDKRRKKGGAVHYRVHL
jgi:hypothetical protein